MHKLLRNTHLLTGLFGCLFVLMYGLSAIQMAHNKWFPMKPRVSEQSYTLAGSLDARAVARELMDRHGVRGDLAQVAGTNFRIVRPGAVCEVRYDASTGEAKVKTNTAGFWGMLNRLHHVRGLWHEYALINLWGGFVALISLAMFLLGATGIYLWFKLYNERVIGLVIMIASFAWSLTAAYLIRTA